jgi:hypothetical protein
MLVTKKSLVSGNTSTMDIDVTDDQLARIETGRELIQNIVPHLSPDEREFLKSGITPQEWNDMFGEDE